MDRACTGFDDALPLIWWQVLRLVQLLQSAKGALDAFPLLALPEQQGALVGWRRERGGGASANAAGLSRDWRHEVAGISRTSEPEAVILSASSVTTRIKGSVSRGVGSDGNPRCGVKV